MFYLFSRSIISSVSSECADHYVLETMDNALLDVRFFKYVHLFI